MIYCEIPNFAGEGESLASLNFVRIFSITETVCTASGYHLLSLVGSRSFVQFRPMPDRNLSVDEPSKQIQPEPQDRIFGTATSGVVKDGGDQTTKENKYLVYNSFDIKFPCSFMCFYDIL